MKLTIIGNGTMAFALAKGLVKNFEVEVIGRDILNLKKMQLSIPEISISELNEKEEDISGKIILFCVKPYALESVSIRLTGKANTILSILAGTKIENLKKHITAKHYIRTMPNIAASHLASMTTITGDKEAQKLAIDIFKSIGNTIWVNTENQLDLATAVAGSGPAYLALIAESLIDGAVRSGLERNISTNLVKGLFAGFTHLIMNTHPALIKDLVTSPGGTTAAGLNALEEGKVRDSVSKAVEAAYNKAYELGQK